jgi:hypothetical protein
VKAIAKDLLEKLKADKLVLDWWRRQQTRSAVRSFINRTLGKGLPESSPTPMTSMRRSVSWPTCTSSRNIAVRPQAFTPERLYLYPQKGRRRATQAS